MSKPLIVTALLILAAASASWALGSWLVAPRPSVVGDLPAGLPGRNIHLESASGSRLAGWHIRNPEYPGVVLLFHGIRASRRQMIERARLLYENGHSVITVDLQAHGESTGEAITMGYLEKYDVQAAVSYARRTHAGEPVGVVGISLGGAAALLGSPLDIDALVIESVYPDIEAAVENRVARFLGPLALVPARILLLQLRWRLGIRPEDLRPIDHLAGIGCPVLVISGEQDDRTTIAETRRMYDSAREPKSLWIVPGAGHVDLHSAAGKEYRARIPTFFRKQFDREA